MHERQKKYFKNDQANLVGNQTQLLEMKNMMMMMIIKIKNSTCRLI